MRPTRAVISMGVQILAPCGPYEQLRAVTSMVGTFERNGGTFEWNGKHLEGMMGHLKGMVGHSNGMGDI